MGVADFYESCPERLRRLCHPNIPPVDRAHKLSPIPCCYPVGREVMQHLGVVLSTSTSNISSRRSRQISRGRCSSLVWLANELHTADDSTFSLRGYTLNAPRENVMVGL